MPHSLADLPQIPHIAYILAALLGWILFYVVYKSVWRRDYGIPVRRSLTCRTLRVERDQVAYAPYWWSDLQVQRALKAHWRRTMKEAFGQTAAVR